MTLRGIRGAVQAAKNSRDAIRAATLDLLQAVIKSNRVRPDDVAAAFFTVTDDLTAEFPAAAARDLGWTTVPMLCNREIPVPGALPRVVRVLLLVNTHRAAKSIRHVYLGETQCLRPDLAPAAQPKHVKQSTGMFRARLISKRSFPEPESTTSSEAEKP